MALDFDLEAYLARIGYTGKHEATVEALREVHLAHASSIPFENLDIQMGLPIHLDLASLQDKLVDRRRGGYCFEHNTLFMAALRAFGFEPRPCEARVRFGSETAMARTHMLLLVEAEGSEFLCDVGFGGEGLLHPLPMDGAAHAQFLATCRVVPEGPLRVLQSLRPEGWFDLYAFVPEAREPIDFELANWYTSTHPKSRFVTTLTAQLPTPEARYVLRNRTYVVSRGLEQETRELEDAELFEILHSRFGLDVPPGAKLRALEQGLR